jgi:hypothetical protein
MRLSDAVGLVLLVMASCAFGCGEVALSEAEDLRSFYWLTVGVVALRASVAVVRPGTRA